MNEETKFRPLTANHGNVSGDIAYLRDTFLNAETDYFRALLESEENLDTFLSLIDYPPDKMYD